MVVDTLRGVILGLLGNPRACGTLRDLWRRWAARFRWLGHICGGVWAWYKERLLMSLELYRSPEVTPLVQPSAVNECGQEVARLLKL